MPRPLGFRRFLRRHRISIQDLSLLVAILLVAAFLAFEYDIYANQDGATRHDQTIELDETLTLGGLLAVGLLVLAVRCYSEQKRETRRRIAAEQHARVLALQDPLTVCRTAVSLTMGSGQPSQHPPAPVLRTLCFSWTSMASSG